MITYDEWKGNHDAGWKNEPIPCTCEVLMDMKHQILKGKFCGKPTVAAYPAMNSGWQSLCALHALKHPEAFKTDELISKGETWG